MIGSLAWWRLLPPAVAAALSCKTGQEATAAVEAGHKVEAGNSSEVSEVVGLPAWVEGVVLVEVGEGA